MVKNMKLPRGFISKSLIAPKEPISDPRKEYKVAPGRFPRAVAGNKIIGCIYHQKI